MFESSATQPPKFILPGGRTLSAEISYNYSVLFSLLLILWLLLANYGTYAHIQNQILNAYNLGFKMRYVNLSLLSLSQLICPSKNTLFAHLVSRRSNGAKISNFFYYQSMPSTLVRKVSYLS